MEFGVIILWLEAIVIQSGKTLEHTCKNACYSMSKVSWCKW